MNKPILTPIRSKDGKFASRKTSLAKVVGAIILGVTVCAGFGVMVGHDMAIAAPTPDIKPVESAWHIKVFNPDVKAISKHKEEELKKKVSEIWDGEKFIPSNEFKLATPAQADTEPVERESEKPRPTGDVQQIIKDAAAKYGVSSKLMLKIAECESGFDPKAANKVSSARGLFQFTKGTWAGVPAKKAPGYRKLMGLSNDLDLRFDPVESANTAAYAIANGGLHNWKADPASYNCWKSAL